MKNRRLKLVTDSGFDTLIAEVKVQNFAHETDVKQWAELVCRCEATGGYECPHDQNRFYGKGGEENES